MNTINMPETCEIFIDETGIVHMTDKAEISTYAQAKTNMEYLIHLTKGVKCLALVDISACRHVEMAARSFYASQSSEAYFYAVAMIVQGSLSRMIGNFFLYVNRPPFELKLFNKPEQGLAWLKEYKQELKSV